MTLRDRFKLELQAHRGLFSELGLGLGHASFLSLWGKALVLYGGQRWGLIDPGDVSVVTDDCIVLRLDRHLQDLSESFSLPKPVLPGQFQLFPALGVVADGAIANIAARR